MTYVVCDGNYVIADKCVSVEYGDDGGMIRRVRDDPRRLPYKSKPVPTTVDFDDAQKLIFPKSGTINGENIKVMVMAGNSRYVHELCAFVEFGAGDMLSYVNVQAMCSDRSQRRGMMDGNEWLVVTEQKVYHVDGDCVVRSYPLTDGLFHIGSGTAPVDAITNFTHERLTALEAYCLASVSGENVSGNFDYYDIARDLYVVNQTLTDRQRDFILTRVEKKYRLTGMPIKTDYRTVK